jgi:hypothetical protein
MKKLTSLLASAVVFAGLSFSANAQNLQLHYDFGRNCATTTVEMFKPDKGGSTFFFVDMDYNPKVSGAYWEISRELNFWQDSKVGWLSAHLEYNGGLNTAAGSFNNAFLVGATYSGHSKDWTKTWSVTASYKAIPGTIGLTASSSRTISSLPEYGTWISSIVGFHSMASRISGVRQDLGREQTLSS